MSSILPSSSRKRALIIVDVQPGFLNKENVGIVERIVDLLHREPYDFIVECIFHAEKGSLWDRQTGWCLPKDKDFKTVNEIIRALAGKEVIHIEKETKSVFKGTVDLNTELKTRGIEEVHIVGLDANDCVLATAYESFDFGYFTYVIEDCTNASSGEHLKEIAFEILRHLNLTDRSRIEKES